MEYEITAGFAIKSKLLYSSDKHLFQKRSEHKSTTYYSCYFKECGARLKVDSTLLCSYVVGASTHIHGIQEDTYKRLKVENSMKVRSSTEKKRPREIFDEECIREQDVTANMQFAKRHRTLKYHQRTGLPQNPKTLIEVKAFFENQGILNKIGQSMHTTKPTLFYQETVINPNFAYVIFSSESILSNLPETRSVRIDCTFKCVPKSPFKQLLILQVDHLNHVSSFLSYIAKFILTDWIFVRIYGFFFIRISNKLFISDSNLFFFFCCFQSFPTLFVLMTRKTEVAYKHLFNNIESRWKIGPKKATTDYETAIKNALMKQYPGIQLISCWFHFCQALAKNAKKIKGFLKFIKDDDGARRVYHKLMCLPLMRFDNIRAAFKLLKEEALASNKSKFTPFLKYIEKQWLQREGPKSISVYMESERTNNPMESYNSTLNFKIPAKGCFYKFVSLLRAEEFIKSRDYNIIAKGGTQLYHKQKKSYRCKNEKILSMQQQFENGKINLKVFFEKAADLYEEDLNAQDDDEDDVENVKNIESDEYDENCEKCHLRLKDTLFQPCLHLKFCAECVEVLLGSDNSMNKSCPECNADVTGRIHVFLWY